jgi:hypothetical protein
MFILLSGLIVVSGFMYYRRYIFSIFCKYIILCILGIIRLYCYFTHKKDGIKVIKTKKLNNSKLSLEEYEVILKTKKHNVVLVGESSIELTKHFNDLLSNISCAIEDKNKIVYCSVVNEDGDIIIELTNMFRNFFYYFDKDDFKMSAFFDYVQDYIDERSDIYNDINIYDFDFIVYLNDLTFTELGYTIKYIGDKSISELLTK